MYLLRALFISSAIFALLGNAYASEPRNLDLVKQDLIRYHDSGEYQKDLARVGQQALAYLKSEVNKAKLSNRRLAIILDIDETALSNYPDMVAMSFGGTSKEIEDAEGKGNDPVIEPTLELYQYAKAHNVAVFFITARREIYRSGTEANLAKAGYTYWDGLYFLPMDYHEKSVTGFKAGIRKKITEQGYDIVLSLSDQKGDLRGGYADKAFKLPAPFYLVP
jgi:predicted secreted acid phosphatase